MCQIKLAAIACQFSSANHLSYRITGITGTHRWQSSASSTLQIYEHKKIK